MPRPRATKKATTKATPRRKAKSTKRQQASQLEVLTQAREYFGKKYDGQVIVMDELDNTVPGYVSSQSLALDWIIGNDGFPMSRIFDVSSDEGGGKSTLLDHVGAEVQRRGGHVWLWDTENARDNRYQEKIGVVRKCAGQILSHTMEDGFALMIDLVNWHNENDPGRPGVILWDTPAGTPTRAEVDPEKKSERFGPAKIIRSQLRTLNQQLQQGMWMLGVSNQTYMGQMQSGQTYKAVYGGGGIPFYSSVRLQLSHVSKFWRTGSDAQLGLPPVGQTMWCKCIKNRVSAPWRSRKLCVHFGEGFNNTHEIFHTLLGAGAMSNASGWCRFDEDSVPYLTAVHSTAFQASADQGGHMKLDELVREKPELWPLLIRAYHECLAMEPR